jgi:DNA ligase-associated metallophosphoesterase
MHAETITVDMSTVSIAGVTLAADLSGALYWEEQKLLVVSDLHLEKGSSYANRGVLLPPYDTIATLGRLGAVIARHDPRIVIALGDSFHDRDAHERLSPANREVLSALQMRRDWIWISGNHDPALPPDLGGTVAEEVAIGPITFRHEPTGAAGEIAGHLASKGARQHARSRGRTALLCERRHPRGDAGLRRLYGRAQHPRCSIRQDLPDPRLHCPCARRPAHARHCRLALLLEQHFIHRHSTRPGEGEPAGFPGWQSPLRAAVDEMVDKILRRRASGQHQAGRIVGARCVPNAGTHADSDTGRQTISSECRQIRPLVCVTQAKDLNDLFRERHDRLLGQVMDFEL